MSAAPKPGWIYVLDPHVTIDGRQVVKIGYTTQSVEKRVRKLSTGAAAGMSILHKMHVDDVRKAEARLHGRFRSKRVSNGANREFFAVDPSTVIAEMDEMGAEVSRKIADQKYGEAIRAFKDARGISAVEKEFQNEAASMGWVAFAANVIGTMVVYMKSSLGFTVFASILVAVGTWKLYRHWYDAAKERKVDRPFNDILAQERARLNLVYPNTTVGAWLRKQVG